MLDTSQGIRLVQVYERAKNYRECGAGITLDVNGMKALRAVDEELFSRFQSTVVTNVNSMQNFDQHGKHCHHASPRQGSSVLVHHTSIEQDQTIPILRGACC